MNDVPRRRAISILAAILLLTPALAAANLVVIVSQQCNIESLTRSQVINIFLGHDRELPNGQAAVPIDLPASLPEKSRFYRRLVNRDLDQVAAYWSRLVFAGSTAPPLQAVSVENALSAISANPRAVGYIDSRHMDGRVKVVFELP